MISIGGNLQAIIQTKESSGKDAIGANVYTWVDAMTITGWLDLSAGDSKRTPFNAKIQESTHIFLCDYVDLASVTPEESRMVINDLIYDILLIDDPMNMNEHLEIYLRFIGGQS